jgi:O-antigen biosynthesis protein WbqP
MTRRLFQPSMKLKENAPTIEQKLSSPALSLKRATDLTLSGLVFLGFLPLFGLIWLAIRLDSPGPALFKQKRVGLNGELFEILKFRTMRVGTPNVATEIMLKMGTNPITRVGAVLRKTSLDELPQLLNVLRGDMSIVGPRPALFNQYELTEKRLRAGALRMLPGITGWAQVNGRDELSDEEKVEYDRWYVENWRYWLDWKIIAKTASVVIDRRGVN